MNEGTSSIHEVPYRIETERLVVRCWRAGDARMLREAIDHSLEHLREWMAWALDEPKSMEETRQRLITYERKFQAGEDFTYGIFDRNETRVIGGSGLHRRIGEDGLEIGYWIRADATGQGFATETAQVLTAKGLKVGGIKRIQIHCDPRNAASRRVPEKLSYRLIERRLRDGVAPDGSSRDTLIFEKP